MDGFLSVSPNQRPVRKFLRRQFPRVGRVVLILGVAYLTLFIGASECNGLWDKPPTNTPHPTNTHRPTDPPVVPTDPPVVPSDTPFVPSDTPIVPTDTAVPTDTSESILTQTETPDCTFGLTPTATGVPTCTPTSTPTPSLTETEMPTDTAPPGGPTSTPKPQKMLAPTGTTVSGTTPTATESGPRVPTSDSRSVAAASVTASITKIRKPLFFPWSGNLSESNSASKGAPWLLLITTLLIGGGAVFAFQFLAQRPVYSPAMGGGRFAAATAINPTTVGAVGFAAWLSGQAPLLTYGEKVVLSKVGNGIGSAMKFVGKLPDLKKISEMGTQEFLQLTTNSPILPAAVWSTGFAGG